LKLTLAIIAAVTLNISGAVVGKYVALNLAAVPIVVPLIGLLGGIYAGRVVFWISVGRVFQLSYIYPVLSINYLFSFLLGMGLFDEGFYSQRLAGALVIMAGVVIVSLSEHRYERKRW